MKNRPLSFSLIVAVAVTLWFAAQRRPQPPQPPGNAATPAGTRTAVSPAFTVPAAPSAPAAPAPDAVSVPLAPATLGAFTAWTGRYLAAPVGERAALEAEGAALAEARRPLFKQLIQDDPRRAIALAVPRVVRQELPPAVVAQLETPVSTSGTYNVYLGRPAPGVPVPKEGLALRYFETAERSYKAHVYGALVPVMSKKNLPLSGYAMDRELAVAESGVRPLEKGERIPAGTVVENVCPVSEETTAAVSGGEVVTDETPTVEIAGRLITLCNGAHVRVLEDGYRTFVQASGPGGGGFFMDNFPGTSSRAIGNLRCLYLRVTYPDQMAAPNTEEQAFTDMRDSARYYLENSFGKMTQTHTVTSVLTLPHTVAWYKAKDTELDGLGLVHDHSRAAARAAGYDSSQYDCIIVRVNKGPRLEGISWGGGTSVWITWDGMDVLNHECGHSLGLGHANSWTSLDGTPYGYGENAEYGNPFDVMGGSGGFTAHYNTVSKRDLGWLPDSYVHLARRSGVYRIYAYDQPTLEEGRRYGLVVAKDSVRQYNLEFHPARGGFLANNALVIYSGMGSNAGHLLDTTQGSVGGKDDGGIAIGRTYSDLEADLHFTVLSKNATTPPSLDIAYQRGPFPGNVAPTATLSASATTVAVGGSVTFTATAGDANGDTLAYEWLFDDGVAGPNGAIFTRSFTSAAHVNAMLTVSDLKGGTVRRSVVVTAGAPSTRIITGTITVGGQPLPDGYVSNGTKGSYTNLDGTYALAGIATGAQTLTATRAGYTFTPSFTNPLTVVAGANTALWTATAPTLVTLERIADATEGGASGTFRLTRTGSITAALTVSVSPAGGTAVKTSDYSFSPDYVASGSFYTFTIAAGSATADVTVAAVNDTAAEGPETITLQLAGGTGYVVGSASLVTMTIADNDTTLPQVSVTASDPYATEGASPDPGGFTFTRSIVTASPLNVIVVWSGGATNGTDYITQATTVPIPANQGSVNVTITPLDDALAEAPEDVSVTISANAAYVRDTSATTATVTLTDDDTPYVTVSVPDASASEGGADSGAFLVTRTGGTAAALKVYYGLAGSALHGTDYAWLNGEVTIPAGATSAPVVIRPYDDDLAEPTETVTLALATFNNTYSVGPASQGAVSITDNGDTPLINVRSGVVGTEGGTNATVIFHAFGSGSGNITVSYTVSGTATAGSDFTALSGTVSVPANGSNDTTLTIPITNDALAEPTETVVVTLAPAPGYRISGDGSAEAIIQDNDSGADRVSVSTYNQSPGEAGPVTGTFYFSRTLTAGALTVNYALSGTATNGVDYQSLTGSVVIPDTLSGVNLTMTPIDDALAEGTETVTMTVLPGTGYGVDRPPSATFEISDNETPAITVGFQQPAIATTEQPGALGEYRDLPVVLSAAAANVVTVNYTGAGGSATGDDVDWGFADAANRNEPLLNGSLTFLPGVVAQSIRIRVRNDGLAEGGESAIIQLTGAFNAALTRGRGQETVTIFDTTVGPLVTEERWNSGAVFTNNTWNTVTPDYTGYLTGFTTAQDVADNYSRRLTGLITAPASGTYTFWVASDDASRLFLSTTASAANKVQIGSLSGWTNFQNWDANTSQKSANITLVAGQSYYLEVQHQEGGGGDHVSVAWQGPGFARKALLFTAPDTAPRSVHLLATATTRLESDGTEPLLQVVLDRPAGSTPVTVDFSASGTATAGADYALTAGTLSFGAGEQMKPIPLTLLPDAVGEAPESIRVSLANAVGAALLAPATHTITLLDAGTPVVDPQFVSAASTQAASTLITTATATPAAGRTIASWSILSGNTGGAFSMNSTGQLRLAVPSALPSPGGVQLIVRATDDLGAAADGAINVICNAGTSAVVEQRWNGSSAFWGEAWTGAPSYSGKLATLTTGQGVGDNYSRRLLAYLKPATSGDYTFWIAGDDDCRLSLSTDGYQANKVQIASVGGWTGFQAWDSMSTQKSAVIPLVAGRIYWIEAQHLEGGGGDHVAVAWSGPGIARVAVPSSVLVPTAPGVDFSVPGAIIPNTAPTISDVTHLTIVEDATAGPLNFTIGDAETNPASLVVSASSSNNTLVPNGNITVAGTGANRSVTLTPAQHQSGTTTITVTVNDSVQQASDTFVLTVTAVNDPPTITSIADQTLALNSSSAPLPFSVGDIETAVSALAVTRTSTNAGLLPTAGLALNGTGLGRTAGVTPTVNQVGSGVVTISVNDGTATTSTSFTVHVTGTPVQTWRQQFFGSVLATGNAADNADPDFDGLVNRLEYALGSSPATSGNPAANLVVDVVLISGSKYLRLTVTKNPNATDVTSTVQVTGDLANPLSWTSTGTTIETNTATALVVRDNTPLSASPRRFIRLQVSPP